ncbi:MAG: flavodoxin family protein [Candidatus Paceibacterota bacterium]
MEKLVVINGSHHKQGTTTKCLEAIAEKLSEKYNLESEFFWLKDNIRSCVSCGPANCIAWCRFQDQFQEIAKAIQAAPMVLIGSPVYLDLPTSKTVAFLSRLNSLAEPTNREFFRGKKVYLHANGYCSGTKAVINAMRGAVEMLGFDCDGRSSTEYVEIWKDRKIRGGMKREDSCYLK